MIVICDRASSRQGSREVLRAGGQSDAVLSVAIGNPVLCALLCLATVCTVFAQFAGFVFSALFYALWLVVLAYSAACGVSGLKLSGFCIGFVLSLIALALFCFSMYIISGELGYITGLLQCMAKVAFIYLIGYFVSPHLDTSALKVLAYVYLASTLAYSAYVWVNYFPGWSVWLDAQEYLFEQKNSFGQIAAVALIVSAVCLRPKSRVGRLLLIVSCAFVAACLLFVLCRTALIAVLVSIALTLILSGRARFVIVAVIIVGLILLVLQGPGELLSHVFHLDKYGSEATLNDLSSGRIDLWASALASISKNPFFGVGDYYVDDLYFNVLANLGILGGGLLLGIWAARVICNLRYRMNDIPVTGGWGRAAYPLRLLLAGLTAFYLFESLLEGLPPLGPGTCSFVFWLLCGAVDSRNANFDHRPSRHFGLR